MNNQTNIPNFTDADKRESIFHDFEKSPEVIGKLIAIDKGTFGEQLKIIGTNNEEIIVGTYNVLTSKIKAIDIGKFIKIVYKGDQINPKTKRTYKDFEVFIKS